MVLRHCITRFSRRFTYLWGLNKFQQVVLKLQWISKTKVWHVTDGRTVGQSSGYMLPDIILCWREICFFSFKTYFSIMFFTVSFTHVPPTLERDWSWKERYTDYYTKIPVLKEQKLACFFTLVQLLIGRQFT